MSLKMPELVPQTEDIEQIYCDPSVGEEIDPALKSRWSKLLSQFKTQYGYKPDFVSRSPGRVNIIGEHIDYSLYNVLPAAVTVDALIAVKTLDANSEYLHIKMANVNSSKYPAHTFSLPVNQDVEIDSTTFEWSNYILAGLRGALRYLKKEKGPTFVPKGMELILDGNVPAGGGLSSSAALVCASALAVMKSNDVYISKEDLLELAIVSERAVGVYSGGMDQAASIFSKRGYLLYCAFFPKFSAEHVPLPPSNPDIAFLIAQSYVTSDKHVTAPRCYNLRVVECTFATVVLAKLHDVVLDPDNSSLGFSLRNFQEEYMRKQGHLDLPSSEQLDRMITLASSTLSKEEGYTREDISSLLGISVATLEKEYMSKFPVQATHFKLRQRAHHVFTEARRVLQFVFTLQSADASGTGLKEADIKTLGDLMNETQASCRDIYECSCSEIDQICEIARRAGALGSRLTGAGWGGVTTHLVPTHRLEEVKKALKTEYYDVKFPGMSDEKLKEAMVISKPGPGSFVITGSALDG